MAISLCDSGLTVPLDLSAAHGCKTSVLKVLNERKLHLIKIGWLSFKTVSVCLHLFYAYSLMSKCPGFPTGQCSLTQHSIYSYFSCVSAETPELQPLWAACSSNILQGTPVGSHYWRHLYLLERRLPFGIESPKSEPCNHGNHSDTCITKVI